MPDWQTRLIDAYRIASLPLRKVQLARKIRTQTVPVMILFYHRVADDHLNPWSISRRDFEQQIDWFQEHFDLVDLAEAQRLIQSGENSRPTLSITFDDGYAENCEYAIPLLVERRVPVTYFVTTQHTTQQIPFAHDVQWGHPLPTNTIESLRAMSLAGVEIGAHTRTHANVGQLHDPSQLADEIIAASVEMEDLIGTRLRYFAFPFGQQENLNAKAFAMLKDAGFEGVCSAYGGWNEVGGDAFHLQRLHGDPNFSRIKNWLSFDSRIGQVKRFPYQHEGGDRSLVEATVAAARSRQGKPPQLNPIAPATVGLPPSHGAAATSNLLPSHPPTV